MDEEDTLGTLPVQDGEKRLRNKVLWDNNKKFICFVFLVSFEQLVE